MLIEKVESILLEQSKNRGNFKLSDLPQPHLLPGVTRASKRIIELLREGKRILIVGDYDCDGIMATTTMYGFFVKLGYQGQVDFIVPDRFVDGYGVSNNMVDYAINNMFDVMVSVDNGIGAAGPVKYARDNGIEVIITDHHTPGEAVPDVDIIVNPKYELGDFPFMEISGATVAWYLCAQINKDMEAGIDMKQWLDLVGITVISDVMPLQSLNVPLVHYALGQIRSGKRYLFELVFDVFKRQTLTETDIGFGFVPMINAVGRLDNATKAINILLSNDKTEIKKGYNYFIETNNKRKYLNEELFKKVLPEAEAQANAGAKAIIVKEENLHEGIVGILAGKLAERFMRPAFVFGWNEKKGMWKGSGRTSGVIQLYDLTVHGSKHAIGFGGHAGAVGVAISKENFTKWFNAISKAAKKFNEKDFIPIGPETIECTLDQMNYDLVQLLRSFAPFGEGFPAPTFKAKTTIMTLNSYKDGLHWKCLLIDQEGNTKESFFFHEKRVSELHQKEAEVIFTPQETITSSGRGVEIHAKIAY